ncbi:tRNA uridine-5-carboxymethylaminomethyl(34) synthesis GTPase MnmE [Ciceribacter sp. L1K22]|uniref:tRNA uridine-5-carboxymethylaminomethyl(34) synthesis GTPase MnmE n=1 Tax=Ciceribacter sp. L1K22 TaxID=2820275 RepID=UPI001ABEADBF|nr:tRNA uridine-5-carboxymethylaminomethyl(34) synthesis GTPase MnmE [Ciceribacter sp. L1K22]MBO3758268.1 tRNA uridine-5-carboxymethylaminomethyl(34) synthesis GTPase MnmE [Ciceribacter sp. L1K22]
MMSSTDTIFALSSGALPAGVAVVRISGPEAFRLCETLAGSVPSPRVASVRELRTSTGETIDQGLVLAFKGPKSFTGEDCVEFHVHGSRAVVAALLGELGKRPNCRMAEPGEFSRRALENGKVDLIEIEGLADLLSAETEMQRKQALEHASGRLSELYERWRGVLLAARASIEADFDFPEEDDIPDDVSNRIWEQLGSLAGELAEHISGANRGEVVRAGYKVALVGPPNAGKSTLLNAIAERDVAITSEVAGTTRDVINCDVDIGGYLVRFSDTAGLRETDDVVEREGIKRAKVAMQSADLVLALNEASLPPITPGDIDSVSIRTIGTKLDAIVGRPASGYDILISARDSTGLTALHQLIIGEIESKGAGMSLVPGRVRQVEHLVCGLNWLRRALDETHLNLEIRAELLRKAADEIGRITGRIDTEMLLDSIFSEFCIGK